jgi:Cu(I)/Ag(I) efflux system periplasmic protein CusF
MSNLSTTRRSWAAAALLSLAAFAISPAQAQNAAAPPVPGEVMKIDKATARITLKHGEIRNLDNMPAMTMVWRVRDPKWLDTLAVGDKVRFSAERIDGQFTVTSIAKAP